MLNRLREGWSSLPAPYKNRVYMGTGAYLALMVALGLWVGLKHDSALAQRRAAVPLVESDIRAVYLTPQLTDLSNPEFNLADIHSATEPGMIALIMTDLGLAKQTDERAINDLPAPVSLAFSPYGKHAKQTSAEARKDGHKVIALLPMEPVNYPKEDPGKLGLLDRHSNDENQKIMTRIFTAVPQADAAMNFMGSRFLSSEENADLVVKTLQARKMVFVESPDSFKSSVRGVARTRNADLATVDIFIDQNASENDIRAQLGELERISRQRGIAVGVIHPFPLTFALLANWLPTLESRNLKLVDVREAVKLQIAAESKPAPAPPAELTPVATDGTTLDANTAEGDEAPPAPPTPPAAVEQAP